MPPKSIYLPEEMIEAIEDELDENQSFSEWIQHAVTRKLEGEFDDLEELTEQVHELQEWQQEINNELLEWFKGEYGPAQ